MQGIIIENISNLYRIKENCKKTPTEATVFEATARGKFKKDEITPVVGDIVKFDVIDKQNKKAVINEILERKVYIKRPKIANITQMIFVVSSKNPKPDLLMLDKQLTFAEFLGIKPLIVLNKTDLDNELEFENIKKVYENIGYIVIKTDCKNKKGIKLLKSKLRDNINAFSGNSGVGKSTLINNIFNKDVALEGEISQRNKRGKNTTTSIKLYEIDTNTYIADTPGFSTFSIEEINSRDLCNYFIEFKKEISKCEFVGCTHIKEEKCGIKQAVEKGKIDKGRYERFCKIKEELIKREERKKW